PTERHLRHLDFKILNGVLTGLDVLVHDYRRLIFLTTGVIVLVSAFGLTKLEALSYMVDDLPEESPLKKELLFFEENFTGVMPLEIVVNTGTKKGVQNLNNLRLINEFELFLDSLEGISQ